MAKARNKRRADGRIAVQVYIGKDKETGKRKYKTVYGNTQKEADEKAMQANAPVDVTPGNNGGSGSKAPANTGKF
ncbi:hypothetical protein D7Y09_13660 [bacterium 1XD42-1]|nr:hypothetical protein D7Y09_13660 [bacterium 1XD42-1]